MSVCKSMILVIINYHFLYQLTAICMSSVIVELYIFRMLDSNLFMFYKCWFYRYFCAVYILLLY